MPHFQVSLTGATAEASPEPELEPVLWQARSWAVAVHLGEACLEPELLVSRCRERAVSSVPWKEPRCRELLERSQKRRGWARCLEALDGGACHRAFHPAYRDGLAVRAGR